jgi:hypothetical protein
MGINSSAVLARYGSLDATLSTLVSQPAPFSNGGVAFGDLTGDGVPDLVIPTRGGLFTFETTSGAPEPVAYPQNSSFAAVHIRAGAVPITGLSTVFGIVLDETVASPPGFEISIDESTPVAPCGDAAFLTSADELQGRALHAIEDGFVIRVPLLIATGTKLRMCLHAFSPGISQELDVPGLANGDGMEAASAGETFYANLGGATQVCPDLVFPFVDKMTGQEMTGVLPGSGTEGSCSVVTTTGTGGAFALPGLPLTAFTEETSKATGLVQSTGIVTIATITKKVTNQIISTRNWRFAIEDDLDGDGNQDVATLGTSTDIEVLTQRPPVGTVPQLDDRRIATDSAIDLITSGDYDGDGIGDIVMVTIDDDDDRTAQLSVSWGAVGPYSEPQPFSEFAEYFGLLTMPLANPSLPGLDQQDDLIVAYGGDHIASGNSDPSRLTDLFGTADRAFVSPWVNKVQTTVGNGGLSASQFANGDGAAVLIGQFPSTGSVGVVALFDAAATGSNGEQNTDLVTASRLPYSDLLLDQSSRVIGAGAGSSTASLGRTCAATPSAAGVGSSIPVGDTAFCPPDVRFVKLSDGRGDVAVALRSDEPGSDSGSDCGYVQGGSGTTLALVQLACSSLAGSDTASQMAADTLYGVTVARVLDTAADGSQRVVVDHASPASSYVWRVAVDSGGVPRFTSPTDFGGVVGTALGVDAKCLDTVSLELGTYSDGTTTFGADLELVTACRIADPSAATGYVTKIFGLYSNPDPAGPPHVHALLDLAADITLKLKTGDINGDRIPDLVYTTGALGQGSVHVHLQCDTHTTGCGETEGS